MKPNPLPVDIDAGLIRMAKTGLYQLRFDQRLKGFQFMVGIIIEIINRTRTDRKFLKGRN